MPTPPRYTIAYEGVETTDGRLLRTGSLELPEGPVPLRLMPQDDDGTEGYTSPQIVGVVRNVRREMDGRITAELHPEPPDWASPEIDVDMAAWDSPPGKMYITGARLRAVTLGSHPAWALLAERPRP